MSKPLFSVTNVKYRKGRKECDVTFRVITEPGWFRRILGLDYTVHEDVIFTVNYGLSWRSSRSFFEVGYETSQELVNEAAAIYSWVPRGESRLGLRATMNSQ
jgi:hypothetical protein